MSMLVGVTDVSQILNAIKRGDPRAAEELLPLVYDELRKLAAARLADEMSCHTLQPTALVHEAYLRLVGDGQPRDWNSRGHFFTAAAEAMRRILVESARRKKRRKHGGERIRIELDETLSVAEPRDDLLAINEALTRLEAVHPAKAVLVKLRYFAGLSLTEAAAALDISPATAKRHWAIARAWLFDALSDPA